MVSSDCGIIGNIFITLWLSKHFIIRATCRHYSIVHCKVMTGRLTKHSLLVRPNMVPSTGNWEATSGLGGLIA